MTVKMDDEINELITALETVPINILDVSGTPIMCRLGLVGWAWGWPHRP